VLVFPEGGRSPTGMLREFKDGAAFIGIKAGVPVVPVALIGTREILPFGSGTINPGPVTLRVGRPIPTASLTLRDRSALTAEIRSQIESLLNCGTVAV
jgi:1-acyl-sn-glycerol-3-phosphate acyltransferase